MVNENFSFLTLGYLEGKIVKIVINRYIHD